MNDPQQRLWQQQLEETTRVFFGQDFQDEQDLRASFRARPYALHPANHVSSCLIPLMSARKPNEALLAGLVHFVAIANL